MRLDKQITGLPQRPNLYPKPDYNQYIYGQPINCCKADVMYIKQQLNRVFPNQRAALIQEYTRDFASTYRAEQSIAKKEGEARRVANTNLREKIDKMLLIY